MEGVFEKQDGDRGANSITAKQCRNMHAIWDRLLGADWSLGGNRRRMVKITQDSGLMSLGKRGAETLDLQDWLEGSRMEAANHVYAPDVMDSLMTLRRGLLVEPEEVFI